MAKDARGHGSDGRGGSDVVGNTRRFSHGTPAGISLHGKFSAGQRSPGYQQDDTKRTISDLRSRLSNTGPGHQVGLLQGIRNFLGGTDTPNRAPNFMRK